MSNINNMTYAMMRIFPKGTTNFNRKPLYVFINYKSDSVYEEKRMSKENVEKSFRESCRKCVLLHKTEFMGLENGYSCIITHVPYNEFRKYAHDAPIYYVTLDRNNPDSKFYNNDVDIRHYSKKKLRKAEYENKKIQEYRDRKNTMRYKYEAKRKERKRIKKSEEVSV